MNQNAARRPTNERHRQLNAGSSDLVLHGRQTAFAMLLVSVLVALAVFSGDSERLLRAMAQLEVVKALIENWHDSMGDDQPRELVDMVADEDSHMPSPYLVHRVKLLPLHRQHHNDANRAYISHIECDVVIDMSQRFLIDNRGRPLRIMVYPDGIDGHRLRIWRITGAPVTWEAAPRGPDTLESFTALWNALVAATSEGRISATYPTAGAMTTDNFLLPVPGPPRSYEVSESTPLGAERYRGREVLTVAALKSDFLGRESQLESVVRRWDEQEAVVSSSCLGATASDAEGSPSRLLSASLATQRLVMPADFSFRRFDWPQAWLRRAIAPDSVASAHNVRSRPFASAFRDLAREATGLEGLEVDELRRWLQSRIDAGEQRIAVVGVSFASGLLRLFGVLLIVAVQSYAALHLSEVAKRMARSPAGDPGAFIPWILLYSGSAARVASLGVIGAPLVAAILVVSRLVEDGWVNSIEDATGLSGLCLCGVLVARSAVYATRICREAERHRAASLSDDEEADGVGTPG